MFMPICHVINVMNTLTLGSVLIWMHIQINVNDTCH
jgi:hypothetical protein